MKHCFGSRRWTTPRRCGGADESENVTSSLDRPSEARAVGREGAGLRSIRAKTNGIPDTWLGGRRTKRRFPAPKAQAAASGPSQRRGLGKPVAWQIRPKGLTGDRVSERFSESRDFHQVIGAPSSAPRTRLHHSDSRKLGKSRKLLRANGEITWQPMHA